MPPSLAERVANPNQRRSSGNGGLQQQASPDAHSDRITADVRNWFNEQNGKTLQGALAFVPFILQQAYFEGNLDEQQIVIHRGSGGVVFSDASGFTALTEKLARKSNGAELLSRCLTAFFTPLIDLINAYRGDTIKFSGDALTIYFPSVNDARSSVYNALVPPHGSFGLPDLGPMATAVLRASACCIEIHKRLHMFDIGIDDVRLCLHIGVGCGEITILQVGGVVPPETHVPRMEYLISGSPLEQISIAEPLAKNGETCLSPQAWEHVKDCVVEGRIIEDQPHFHILLRMEESKYTFPTIKYATQLYDQRADQGFSLSELNVIRRYTPSFVFKQIECGTLQYVNEMRNVSVIFISGSGLNVMSEKGPKQAQELMASVQRVCYAHEGTLNKFLIDDKGMLFLLVFGLPPMVHPDDPTRAVLACMELVQVFKRQDLVGRFGVTTGRNYCGVCGSAKRMEYTVLGDTVNLSARLMANAPPLGILCDESTSKHSSGEIIYKALAPIKVKGKANPIAIFKPTLKEVVEPVGLTANRKIRFPWYDNPIDGSNLNTKDPVAASKIKVRNLCSINQWAGIAQVQGMLGGPFNKAIHNPEQTVPCGPARAQAPPGSPFAEGGVVVIEGATGFGKAELAEHVVTHCATQFSMLPIFGTMGPRPGERKRMAVELLRSTVGVFRHLDPAVPHDDMEALLQIAPPHLAHSLAGSVPLLRELLSPGEDGRSKAESTKEIFQAAVKVVIELLHILKQSTSVLVVLQFEHGTSLFPSTTREDQAVFWELTAELNSVVQQERSIAGLVLCREADRSSPAVAAAQRGNSFVELKGLSDENMLEYMSSYLNIDSQAMPNELRRFVGQVTLGNPLYVRETLDQLMEEQHLLVKEHVASVASLDRCDIASWNHTAMVGGTYCLLESLDPVEAAALKMSTCFEGLFTLPDLAASSCSSWGGATHFDLLRLYRATRKLISMDILETVEGPTSGGYGDRNDRRSGEVRLSLFGPRQFFQMRSVLVRTIGAAMVLEAQRKSVKRNALIDRVLKQDLPDRMSALQAKRSAQHIPWYYERALRRMV